MLFAFPALIKLALVTDPTLALKERQTVETTQFACLLMMIPMR